MLSKKGLLRVTIFVFQTNYNFKMLITPERKVPQRSDASQNDHKSKGYPAKTSGVLPKVPKKVPNKGKPIESIGWLDVYRITQKLIKLPTNYELPKKD